jgi:hypothetical protein
VQVEDLCEAGEVATVYNLCVADYHTYFVGSPEWGFSVWAHNADYPKNSGAGGGGGGSQIGNGQKPQARKPGDAGPNKPAGGSSSNPKADAGQAGGGAVAAPRPGQPGKMDHKRTVGRLRRKAEEEFEGQEVYIHESTSIKNQPNTKGLDRRPDIWVEDPETGKVLKIYEAARERGDDFVPRELLKQEQYDKLGIDSHFEPVRW